MSVWRSMTRLVVVFGCLLLSTAVAVSPAAAAQGVTVEITELTGDFEAGADDPVEVTVVASKRSGRDCLKVRWSMVLRVEGTSLDEVRVDRIEEDGSFPLDVETQGDEARLTDVNLDPGTLCRNRTVTARYALEFDERATEGRMTLRAEAYDARAQFLESATTTRNVEGEEPDESPTPAEPSEEPSEEPAAETSEAPVAGGGVGQPIDQASSAEGGSGLLPVGLAIGGMMLFLGLTLLLRARRKLLRATPVVQPGMTGVWRGGARTVRRPRWR